MVCTSRTSIRSNFNEMLLLEIGEGVSQPSYRSLLGIRYRLQLFQKHWLVGLNLSRHVHGAWQVWWSILIGWKKQPMCQSGSILTEHAKLSCPAVAVVSPKLLKIVFVLCNNYIYSTEVVVNVHHSSPTLSWITVLAQLPNQWIASNQKSNFYRLKLSWKGWLLMCASILFCKPMNITGYPELE